MKRPGHCSTLTASDMAFNVSRSSDTSAYSQFSAAIVQCRDITGLMLSLCPG